MLYVRYLFLLFGVTLLESTLAQRLALGPVRLDLSLALVVYAGLHGGARGGTVIGFIVGLLRGCAEPGLLGLESLLLACVGFGVGSAAPMVIRDHPLVQAVLIALSLLLHDLVRLLVVGDEGLWGSLWVWLSVSPATAAYTGMLVPFAVAVLPRLLRTGGRRAVS